MTGAGHVECPAPSAPRGSQPSGTAVPRSTVARRELALYVGIMLGLAGARLALAGGPQFFNDSYQYLSVAENLRERGAIATSIVHFDEERARGVLPAPETTFPPGYALLIAALSWTTLPLPWAGLLLSLVAGIAVLPLLRACATGLSLGAGGTRASLLIWAFSAQASLYAVTLYAEAVFTFVCVGALALLLRDLRQSDRPSWRAPAALLMLGVAFWVRYAGLFFVVAVHAFALVHLARSRAAGAARWALSLLACDVVVALLMARNVAIAGAWTGGNSRPVHHDAGLVAHWLAVSAYELTLGSIRDPRSLAVGPFIVALAGGAVLFVLAAGATRAWRIVGGASVSQAALLLLCVAGMYSAAMVYSGMTSQISLSARMFVPLLPVIALLAGLAVEFVRASRLALAAGALLSVGYVGANVTSTFAPARVAEHRLVAEALAAPMESGEPLLRWFERTVPADAVLLAVEGQATGHVLQRETVSVVGRLFTDMVWDEGEVRRTVEKFGVDYVIVYPQVVASGGVDRLDSEFLRDLSNRRPRPWLELAASNGRALVYRPRP